MGVRKASPIRDALPKSWDMSASEIRLHNLNQLSEKQFQDMVINIARSLGFTLIYHTYDSRRSEPGFPDLILVNPQRGITLWRELKSAKGRVSKAQQAWIDGARLAGNDVGIWRPEDIHSERIQNELLGKVVGCA